MAANTESATLPKGILVTTTEVEISHSSLRRVLQGIAVATKTSDTEVQPLLQWISSIVLPSQDSRSPPFKGFTFVEWTCRYDTSFPTPSNKARHIFSLALIVSCLRHRSRTNATVSLAEVHFFWTSLFPILIAPELTFTVSRSAQGFLAVPLCSLIEDGCISELFRFHVWMPDGKRSAPGLEIHSHQPWARSWVLAGEAIDRRYVVEKIGVNTCETAKVNDGQILMAEYALAWSGSTGSTGKDYKTHQVSSTVKNTGKLARVTPGEEETHTRGDSYSIDAGVFHTTDVQPDELHATLFFFDANGGFLKDAGVLGPKDADEFTQVRDPAGITAGALAKRVSATIVWEDYICMGQEHAERADWESAFKSFNSALNLCKEGGELPNAKKYRYLTMGKLGDTNRRFGRYDHAREILEEATSGMEPGYARIQMSGELGVVLRHLNLLSDAKVVLEGQYRMAKELGLDGLACRALGNLGMVNYQLSQKQRDDDLLNLATEQLEAGVEASWVVKNKTWESIGLARLSLCYSAKRNPTKATDLALQSLNITYATGDPTVVAMSRFFYGRALLQLGKHKEALEQFNTAGTCTSAMAFCKEPSDEHRQYLQEIVDAGADLELTDEHGYTALDYAVFNDQTNMQDIIVKAFRKRFGIEAKPQLETMLIEAKLKKGYREIFQEKLRPVLLSGGSASKDIFQNLRNVYKNALDTNLENRQQFDRLKFIRYLDFEKIGKLPSYSEGLLKRFDPDSNKKDFVIFFSYRWINKEPGATSPDSVQNTQYCRMIDAIEQFLKLHPDIDKERLNVWIDYSCVDQSDPMTGVRALPMIISQCNALISLMDEVYFSRAWCAVEIMMIQALRKTYKHHIWYQHVKSEGNASGAEGNGTLKLGPMGVEIVMAEKNLSYESDRPQVMFLERQSKLLG